MTRSNPRWLLPFVFTGAIVGDAPTRFEPLFSPGVAAVMVAVVAFVTMGAAVLLSVALDPPDDRAERAGTRLDTEERR